MLGAAAAQRLGIDRVYPGERIWVGGMWFYVAGILASAALAPEIDSSVLVGFAAAKTYLQLRRPPAPPNLRPRPDTARSRPSTDVLAATANPEAPNEVNVTQPSAALTAEPTPRAPSTACSSASAPSRCSSARSASPTS